MLITPMTLAFVGTACAEEDKGSFKAKRKTLVAYLSRSGNTQVIARTLHRQLSADLFEIRPTRPYPEDYEQHVAQATRERDGDFEPPLAEHIEGISTYEEIFLGFPIWNGTAPSPIRSFLKAHDFSGTTIRPFITHGGFGTGSALPCSGTMPPTL